MKSRIRPSAVVTHGVVQPCAWVEECDGVPSCAQSCVLNAVTMSSTMRLKSRQYGEGSPQICPELALWVNLTRPGDKRTSTVRKLLEVRPAFHVSEHSDMHGHTQRI